MKSLAKNSLFNALYQVLNLLFPLISSMYVARTLTPEGIGRVAYAQNIASYFVTAATLGIPISGIKIISTARDDRDRLNKSFSELFILNAVSTTVSLAVYLVLIFSNQTFRADINLYLAVGIVIAANYINIDWLYQGQEEYVYIVVRSIAIKILSLCALFLFVHDKNDYLIYAVITSVATSGNYLLNIFRARNYVTFQIHFLNIKQHFKPIFFLAGSIFFGSIYSKIDTTMIGVMVGEASVGFYSYAHKVLQIGIGFCTAVTTAFLPRLSYCYINDKKQFHELVRKGIRFVAFLSIPASVGLFVLAPEAIIVLFGTEFLPAARTLRVFSVLILVFSFGNLLCHQMMLCSGKEKTHVVVLAIAATINVILNSSLIPRWKQDGAAIASVCTELFINLAEGIYFYRLLKLRYDWKAIGQAIVCALLMGLSIALIKPLLNGSVMGLLGCIIGGVCIYVGLNVMMKNRFTLDCWMYMKRAFTKAKSIK